MDAASKRLERALEKNLADLSNGVLKRRAYNLFMSLKSGHPLDFFRIAMHALHNDLYADAHRVFDKHRDTASIYYIRRRAPAAFERAVEAAGVSVAELEAIAAKLNHIRDRIQFHTDKRAVVEPSAAWAQAGLTGNEFIKLTEQSHEVLRLMYLELTGQDRPIPDYHGEDIEDILHSYKEQHPNAPLSLRPRKA
jgi:hypothetical protein